MRKFINIGCLVHINAAIFPELFKILNANRQKASVHGNSIAQARFFLYRPEMQNLNERISVSEVMVKIAFV